MPVDPSSVFVNCPFDDAYRSNFYAIVYVVIRSGFRMRCALETDDAGDNRFAKICGIISECKFGIHDISRTEVDGDPPLPRFNMPLELGLFLGAKKFGGKAHAGKICIIFDREPYRFQKFISDIAGQDIHSHGGDELVLIRELSTWLRAQPGGKKVGGGAKLSQEYAEFGKRLPEICAIRNIETSELSFSDMIDIIAEYVLTIFPEASQPAL